ncbi:TetR/AcrR family transcriptional regulator [Streptomyces sp. NBS 14/10]|uniref:TetR/AcrR family transcriptional regulator n=1 Tax=Streptomyces sp. NBS 14/10 TaxID=1945643 RepID=UPI000B7F1F85|nr:TetR/AcrR family transcriptional regulator [Streptomyces sp. NBS 14/10]KAK1179826.1 TetR/AcrR family transcriptional regulator [Streptomyces sp. NBS 14/10]NUS86050.1 TetR/AcrR family transcriptional regulator [Streptomyces sp.]
MSPRKSVAEARRTRERITERGVAIASVEGLEGLTIGRLATDLGMSKAGVLGHFGTKQALQLATLDAAAAIYSRLVWEPAQGAQPGLPRLRAICEAWITYLETARDTFPGGCLFTTASIEFDARDGLVHDAVARLFGIGRRRLAAEVRTAVAAGELPADTDPEQIAYELVGLYMALNQEIQLFAAPEAAERTRRALDRILAPRQS